MSILNNLNDMQKKAAIQTNGPCLILAGAGSGKTRTITYKIAYMVKELGIDPKSIVALTFTNKAADEMKERINQLIEFNSKDMIISTFHSFSVRLLRRYGSNIGFNNSFNIYDTDDSKSVIKNILKELQYDGKNTPAKFLNRISKLKESEKLPENISEFMNLEIRENKEFYEIYDKYQNVLKNNNCMDFSDILLNCKKLLNISSVLEDITNTYKYILVDEYQDTNKLQYDIVQILAGKNKNICVVGDEDQSIYGFRGADISNILNFQNDYPDAHITKLEQNYRSTQNILNLANSVISKNSSSLGKRLWSSNEIGEKTRVYKAQNAYDEARFIAEVIRSENRKYSDFTILYRTNFQSRILEQELTNLNIPCKVFGGLSFFQRKEIKDLLSYLIIINNPYDFINFERAITNPKRKIGTKTIAKIAQIASEKSISLIDALKYENSTYIANFNNLIQSLILKSKDCTISELLNEIVDKIEYMKYLETQENFEDRKLNVFELFNSIDEIEKNEPTITLNDYLSNISLSSNSDNISDDNYVKLMTIHSSKGLEFDTVFLSGFERNLFPNINSTLIQSELEEERRLLYVAITRAKKKLYLTYADQRVVNGVTSYNNRISPFYEDMDHSLIHNLNISKIEKTPKIENFNPIKKPIEIGKYKLGQIVTHKSYGRGKIVQLDEKSIYIDFSSDIKKIAMIFADKVLID